MNQRMSGSKTINQATGKVMDVEENVDDVDMSEVTNSSDSDEAEAGDIVNEIPLDELERAEQARRKSYDSAAKSGSGHNGDQMQKAALRGLREKSISWAKEHNESGHSVVDNDTRRLDSSSSRIGSGLSQNSGTVEMAVQQANYLKRKRIFIASAAGLLAFNNGFLNGATLSGLASPGSKFPSLTVTGVTASYSLNGLFLSQGRWEEYGIHLGIILSYFTGCFIAGYITPNPKPYRLEPTYGPTFILGGIFLLIGGIIASFWERYGVVAYWFSATASGIQNGIASRYSSNLIRCTVTGTTTDCALILAQLIRGAPANIDNGIVIAIITVNFWFGGALSFFAAHRFLKYTLLANAVMFWIIGFGIIFFLVSELGLSVNAAVSGNWKWRKTMQSLREASAHNNVSLMDMFDEIDTDKSGDVSPEELLDALLKHGIKTNLRTVRVLVQYADANNNGTIDRDEWATIVEKVMDGSPFDMKTQPQGCH